MNKDPIVEEVRKIRKEIEKKYKNADEFYNHLIKQQRKNKSRLVRRHPKYISKLKSA